MRKIGGLFFVLILVCSGFVFAGDYMYENDGNDVIGNGVGTVGNGYVSFSDKDDYTPQGNFIMYYMIYVDKKNTDDGGVYKYASCSDDRSYVVYYDGDSTGKVKIRFFSKTGVYGDVSGNTILEKGKWHNVFVSFEGGVVSLYVDGVLDGSGKMGFSSIANDGQDVMLGSYYSYCGGVKSLKNSFIGKIDAFQIWTDVTVDSKLISDIKVAVAKANEEVAPLPVPVDSDCDLSSCFDDFGLLNCVDAYAAGTISEKSLSSCKTAWKYVCSGTPKVKGDMNADGKVDDTDLEIITAIWALDSEFDDVKKINCADVNSNGKLDDFDVLDLADLVAGKNTNCQKLMDVMNVSWHARCGDAKYDTRVDIDSANSDLKADCYVDFYDLLVISGKWGDETWCSERMAGGGQTSTCVEYDGGKNYYKKSSLKFSDDSLIYEEYCLDSDNLLERFCGGDPGVFTEQYVCPGNCEDGACVNTTYFNGSSCSDLVNMIKSPEDIKIGDIKWKNNWNNSGDYGYYDSNGDYIKVKSYYADYRYDGNNRYGYTDVSMSVLDEGDEDVIQGLLDELLSYDLCVLDNVRIYEDDSNDYKDHSVYVCKSDWDNVYKNKEIRKDNYWKSARVIWFSGNNLFETNFGESDYNYWDCYDDDCYDDRDAYFHQEEQASVVDFLSKLIDNRAEYVDVSVWTLNWESKNLLDYFLGLCSSDIKSNESVGGSSGWSCVINPAICPAHGYQTQTCSSYNYNTNKEDVRTAQVSCNPGICNGCYIPKWFEQSALDDKRCIPYGFRFEQQVGWTTEEIFREDRDSSGLSVSEANNNDDVDLIVYKNGTALLSLETNDNEIKSLFIEEGEEYNWNEMTGGSSDDSIEYILFVDEIYYDSKDYENSYIQVTFIIRGYEERRIDDTINAYCDMNGEIGIQKVDWAKCQNNYECDSNLCSGHECTGINAMIKSASGLKSFGARIMCRLGSIFGLENYDECIVRYLGNDYVENSGGSAGGGSSAPPEMPD